MEYERWQLILGNEDRLSFERQRLVRLTDEKKRKKTRKWIALSLTAESIGIDSEDYPPSLSYYASQDTYYYGHKLHAVYGLSEVIHYVDLTKASAHDLTI